ncbi:hypothetical protein DB895_03030 [Flavobacterium psychrotolerans]|uniref:C4-dicarboxylate ABC transporter n=1 Tax=Flavobacterium psychrotolerans TaxID=2169410 RepID=A0A2U1JML9_9FLAO|nr:hypothetical protein DB895_03030 [Flavobacterium psychrotolerans]
MLNKMTINFKKKSLKERFLLVIGMFFFLLYLVLGLTVIFWKEFPIVMQPSYRIAFGIILIVYSFFRFMRFINSDND